MPKSRQLPQLHCPSSFFFTFVLFLLLFLLVRACRCCRCFTAVQQPPWSQEEGRRSHHREDRKVQELGRGRLTWCRGGGRVESCVKEGAVVGCQSRRSWGCFGRSWAVQGGLCVGCSFGLKGAPIVDYAWLCAWAVEVKLVVAGAVHVGERPAKLAGGRGRFSRHWGAVGRPEGGWSMAVQNRGSGGTWVPGLPKVWK